MKKDECNEVDLSERFFDKADEECGIKWLASSLLVHMKNYHDSGAYHGIRDKQTYESPNMFLRKKCRVCLMSMSMIFFSMVMIPIGAYLFFLAYSIVKQCLWNDHKIVVVLVLAFALNLLLLACNALLKKFIDVLEKIELRVVNRVSTINSKGIELRRSCAMWLMIFFEFLTVFIVRFFYMKKANRMKIIKLNHGDEDLKKISEFLSAYLKKNVIVTADGDSNEFEDLTVWTTMN